MGNMSYCMFRNTLGDLRECVRRMEDNDPNTFIEDRDEGERKAFESLVKECRNFADDYESLVRQKSKAEQGAGK